MPSITANLDFTFLWLKSRWGLQSGILTEVREDPLEGRESPSLEGINDNSGSAMAARASEPFVVGPPATDLQLAKDVAVAIGVFVLVVLALLVIGL